MSGGRFEYNQYKIGDIADKIQAELDNMGKEIPESELMALPDIGTNSIRRINFIQHILMESLKN